MEDVKITTQVNAELLRGHLVALATSNIHGIEQVRGKSFIDIGYEFSAAVISQIEGLQTFFKNPELAVIHYTRSSPPRSNEGRVKSGYLDITVSISSTVSNIELKRVRLIYTHYGEYADRVDGPTTYEIKTESAI